MQFQVFLAKMSKIVKIAEMDPRNHEIPLVKQAFATGGAKVAKNAKLCKNSKKV